MKILSAEFVASAVHPGQYPRPELPKIGFLGRSNVGKSSLINRLTNRKNLARTSSRPGKTQTVNFYRINQQFDLVDLPGYGFAKVPKEIHTDMQGRIGLFLDHLQGLRGLVQLIDSRHEPSALDLKIGTWIQSKALALAWVIVKIDKVSHGRVAQSRSEVTKALSLPPEAAVVAFSAVDGRGKNELWSVLSRMLAANPGKNS